MKEGLLILMGFSEGIVVGSGVVALLTLLDIIPRLCQITRSYSYIGLYQIILIVSTFLGSMFSLMNYSLKLGIYFLVFSGFSYGIFVGMLASALAEAVDVIPIIGRRLNIDKYMKYIIISLILGKSFGSILNWTIFKMD
ncbi:stage V sporulation protein AB [Alkalithermobacter thermoalcaliphilus JW-YL-7 = DSM 7308]|uniref:Stage V sporulation protein AB n=1 Tax=Alkalithermobacter thermoalcaliphilus JW-YL-7 = DSM 7308 TaxID=1121328 RepID=A0A150FPB4_CLOPD|nr:Stage V sporulation protein AB [[Clostridium] paradoxum JW-YL-7 = DSM 7308]SHK53612.1 stage V sporulation protein AB [[Clostridium] paradoxum JW-YL-7 = DSM 7308]